MYHKDYENFVLWSSRWFWNQQSLQQHEFVIVGNHAKPFVRLKMTK